FRDVLSYAVGVMTVEMGSVSDNPIVTDDGEVISGGNFHGQPVAVSLDALAGATVGLASISERRLDRLLEPPANNGLPAFLGRRPSGSRSRSSHPTASSSPMSTRPSHCFNPAPWWRPSRPRSATWIEVPDPSPRSVRALGEHRLPGRVHPRLLRRAGGGQRTLAPGPLRRWDGRTGRR